MKGANVRLSPNCNHKCLFCTNGEPSGRGMNTEEAKEKIKELLEKGVESIDFTGGEPTIRNDLAELCLFAKKEGMKEITVQTNGELLCEKGVLEKLKESGVDGFLLSLHSHKKEISDKLTQTESFEKTLQAIKSIVERGMRLIISFVINKENFREMREFAEFTGNISKKIRLHFSFIRPNGRAAENKFLVPKICEAELHLHKAMEYCKKNEIIFSMEGVPLCYMDKFEKNSSDMHRNFEDPRVYIDYKGEEQDNAYKVIALKYKKKAGCCSLCRANDACCGVWKEYADIFGVQELYPLFEDLKELGKNG